MAEQVEVQEDQEKVMDSSSSSVANARTEAQEQEEQGENYDDVEREDDNEAQSEHESTSKPSDKKATTHEKEHVSSEQTEEVKIDAKQVRTEESDVQADANEPERVGDKQLPALNADRQEADAINQPDEIADSAVVESEITNQSKELNLVDDDNEKWEVGTKNERATAADTDNSKQNSSSRSGIDGGGNEDMIVFEKSQNSQIQVETAEHIIDDDAAAHTEQQQQEQQTPIKNENDINFPDLTEDLDESGLLLVDEEEFDESSLRLNSETDPVMSEKEPDPKVELAQGNQTKPTAAKSTTDELEIAKQPATSTNETVSSEANQSKAPSVKVNTNQNNQSSTTTSPNESEIAKKRTPSTNEPITSEKDNKKAEPTAKVNTTQDNQLKTQSPNEPDVVEQPTTSTNETVSSEKVKNSIEPLIKVNTTQDQSKTTNKISAQISTNEEEVDAKPNTFSAASPGDGALPHSHSDQQNVARDNEQQHATNSIRTTKNKSQYSVEKATDKKLKQINTEENYLDDPDTEAEEERVRLRREEIQRQRHEQLQQIELDARNRQEREDEIEVIESAKQARRNRVTTNQTQLHLLRSVPIDKLDEWTLSREHRAARVVQKYWRAFWTNTKRQGKPSEPGKIPAVSMPPPSVDRHRNGNKIETGDVGGSGTAFMLNTPEIEFEDLAATYKNIKSRAKMRVMGNGKSNVGTARGAHENYQELLHMRGQVEVKLSEYVQGRDEFKENTRSIQNNLHTCTRMSEHLRAPRRLEEYERDLERMSGVASKFGDWFCGVDGTNGIDDLHPDGKQIMPRREFVELVRARFRAVQDAAQHAHDDNKGEEEDISMSHCLVGVDESDLMTMLDHVLPFHSRIFDNDVDLFGTGDEDEMLVDVDLLKTRDWTTLAPPSTSSLHAHMPEHVKRAHRERLTNASAAAHGKWWRVIQDNKQQDIRDWALGTDPTQIDPETDKLGSKVWTRFCGGVPSDLYSVSKDEQRRLADDVNGNVYPNDELIARNAAQVVGRIEQLLAIHGEQTTGIRIDEQNDLKENSEAHDHGIEWDPIVNSDVPNAIGSPGHIRVDTRARPEEEDSSEYASRRRTRSRHKGKKKSRSRIESNVSNGHGNPIPNPNSSINGYISVDGVTRIQERDYYVHEDGEIRSPSGDGHRSEREEERTRRRRERKLQKQRRRSRSASASGRLAKQLMEKMDLLTERLHTLEGNTKHAGVLPPLPLPPTK